MLVEKSDDVVISSGSKQTQSYEIGDVGFILGLLRSKVYSNIVKAICQEYSSNARDAHREVGKGNIPIQLTMPSSFDHSWRCRDFGPGISPDRIANVFIRYGNSTKRDSNNQTGGFGIGAKSALGYTDSFIINTFIDGVKRSYNSVIDQSKQGTLTLMHEGPTTEPNGTEIVVPVKTGDNVSFINETVKATKHWSPRPVFVGTAPQYPSIIRFIEGSDWFMEMSSTKSFVAILDGIEYPIDTNQIDPQCLPRLSGNIKTYVILKTGDLSVSVNREALEMTPATKKKLEECLFLVKKELKEKAIEMIQQAPTYLDACIDFKRITNTLYCEIDVKEVSWNGKELTDTHISLNYMGYATKYSYNRHKNVLEKARHGTYSSFSLEKDMMYLYTSREFDKKIEPTLKWFFNNDPKSKNGIQVIRITDENFFKKVNVKELGFIDLEDHFIAPIDRKEILGKLTIFQYNGSGEGFGRTSMKVFEEAAEVADSTRAYVFLTEDKQPLAPITMDMIRALSKIYKCKVFGFKSGSPELKKKINNLLENEEGLVSLESLLKEEVDNIIKNQEEYEILRESMNSYHSHTKYYDLVTYGTDGFKDSKKFWANPAEVFVNKDSIFLKFLGLLTKLQKREAWFTQRSAFMYYINENSNKPRVDYKDDVFDAYFNDIKELKTMITTKYPLLKVSRSLIEQIQYVNMVDTIEANGYTLPVLE